MGNRRGNGSAAMPTEKPSEHQIDPGDPAQGKIRSKFVARLRPRKTDEAERKVSERIEFAEVMMSVKRKVK